MTRKQIVASLMIEGFKEKTLVELDDKALRVLANRILGEQYSMTTQPPNPANVQPVTNVSKTDVATQNALKQQKKPFSTYESEMSEEESKAEKKSKLVTRIKKKIEFCKKNKDNPRYANKIEHLEDLLKRMGEMEEKELEAVSLNEWVNKIVEKHVHPFTSKSEIMELVQSKLMEQEVEVSEPKISKKIPEFLSYDEIVKMGGVEVAPAKPTTKPTTKPGTRPDKDNPYKPGPGKNPKPKALKEE